MRFFSEFAIDSKDQLGATTPVPAGEGADRYARTEISSPGGTVAPHADALVGPTLGPGDIIAGKYQIERVLGEGGMGMVFAATHLQLREPVALKFMNAAALANPEASARFVREARAAARLRGEHVCRVLDLGETDAGDRYIVIEYLDGKDLSAVLAERGTLTVAEAIDYVLQACEAMAEAHGAGIVHRDLKPANLFLTTGVSGEPSIKVVDFGISKLINPETNAQVVTTTRSLMGSPLYMAPEQLVSAKDVDERSDIWALGTVLFQLVSGRTPFEASSLPEVVAQVLHNDPPRLSSLIASSPRRLDAVVARCLAKDRDLRYRSVAELAADLAEVSPQSSQLAMRSAAVLGAARNSRAQTVSAPPPRRRWAVSAIAAAVVLAAAAIAALIAARTSEPAKTDGVTPAKTQVAEPVPAPAAAAPAITPDAQAAPLTVIEEPTEVPTESASRRRSSERTRSGEKKGQSGKAAGDVKDKPTDLLEPDLEAPVRKKKPKVETKKSDVLEPEI